jgi:hypothetical protein
MAGRLLSDRDHETLRRTIEQVQRQHSNSRGSLARRGVRRHQGGYKPAVAAGVSCYYYLTEKKSFAGSGSSATLATGNLTGWCGATYVIGNQTEVGVSYDDSEADPDTNGNWSITKTGTYGVRFWGGVNLGITGAAIPTWQIKLYRKPSASAIGEFADSLGGFPMRYYSSHWFNAAPSGGSTSFTVPVNHYGFAYLTSGDKVTVRMQLTDATNATVAPFASPVGLRLTFSYLSDTEMTDTDVSP